MSAILPAFTGLLREILLSQLFIAIVSTMIGSVSSVLVGVYLTYRLNHIQRIAEVTHAVAADTNQIVNDNTNGNGGKSS